MKVLEKKDNFIEVEVNESSTLLSLIVEKLQKMENIESAAFATKHLLFEKMRMYIKGNKIKESVKRVCREIEKECEDLLAKVK